MLTTAKKAPVLILASEKAVHSNPEIAQQISRKGAELLVWPDTQGESNLQFLLDDLSRRGVQQLLVEGGPTVITSFLKEQLADEICVYIAPKILGQRGSAGITEPMAELTEAVGLHYVDIKRFSDDIRLAGLTEKAISELSIAEG